MTSPSFQIGQEVEIIGPDSEGYCDCLGHKFSVSSLRLVEPAELKIGDYAEVVKSDSIATRPYVGKIIKVCFVGPELVRSEYGRCHAVSNLRKLTPEEIKQRTDKDFREVFGEIQKLLIPSTEARLDAIESDNEIMQKRLTKIEKLQSDQYERMNIIQMRVGDVESYQKGEMPDCKPNDES